MLFVCITKLSTTSANNDFTNICKLGGDPVKSTLYVLAMDNLPVKYKCLACNQAVLNRRIDHCLYCGASLPPDFLFSKEKIARLDDEQYKRDELRKSTNPGQTVERSNLVRQFVGGADLLDDLL